MDWVGLKPTNMFNVTSQIVQRLGYPGKWGEFETAGASALRIAKELNGLLCQGFD